MTYSYVSHSYLLCLSARFAMSMMIAFFCPLVYPQVTDLPPLSKPEKDKQQPGADVRGASPVRPPVKPRSRDAAGSRERTESAAPQKSESSAAHIAPNASNSPVTKETLKPDISAASQSEQRMIEHACGYYQRTQGPAAYYSCLTGQMRQLNSLGVK